MHYPQVKNSNELFATSTSMRLALLACLALAAAAAPVQKSLWRNQATGASKPAGRSLTVSNQCAAAILSYDTFLRGCDASNCLTEGQSWFTSLINECAAVGMGFDNAYVAILELARADSAFTLPTSQALELIASFPNYTRKLFSCNVL
jgi:hypothetical protein